MAERRRAMAPWRVWLVLLALLAGGSRAASLPDPDDERDRLMMIGSLAELRGDLGAAATAYRRCLAQPDPPASAALFLFRLGLAAGDGEALEAAGPFLLRKRPASPEAGIWLDRLYARGQLDELRGALASVPDSVRPALRIQLLLDESLAGRDKRREAELERRLGELLRLDAAAWERRDITPRLFWEQCLAFAFRCGRSATVAAWIDSSRLAADEPAAWTARCRLAAFQEDVLGLRRALEKGRALDSLEAFFPMMEGRLALADGLPVEALAHLVRARRLDPQDPDILALLAAAQEECGRLDEAESTLRLLLVTHSDDAAVWMRLGALLDGQGRRDEALALYGRALDQLGEDGMGGLLKNNYAYLLAQRGGDPELALRLARQAVAEEPDNAAYRDTLGWLLFLTGQYAAAEGELERAYDLCRGELDPEILEHLGRLRERQGRVDEANALFQRAQQAAAARSRPGPRADGETAPAFPRP